MGLGGISIWQLLIILAIVLAVFGTKRFKNIGSDLGSAIKGFRSAVTDEESKPDSAKSIAEDEDATFENTPSEAKSEETKA